MRTTIVRCLGVVVLAACGGGKVTATTTDSSVEASESSTESSVDAIDSGCSPGTERCACYGNGTCNNGLTCASDLCVVLPTDTSDADSVADSSPSTDADADDAATDADATVDSPAPVMLPCPAGQVRVHVKDVWSASATPTLSEMTSPPIAVSFDSPTSYTTVYAWALPDGAHCGWYSACLSTGVTSISINPLTSATSICLGGVGDLSGAIDLSTAIASGNSDVWIADPNSTISFDQFGSLTRASTAFTVTANNTDIDSTCTPGDAAPATPSGFVKLHVRWLWGNPSVSGYPGTGCETIDDNITTPPFPSALGVIVGCGLAATLDLADNKCPWYTTLVPSSAWDDGELFVMLDNKLEVIPPLPSPTERLGSVFNPDASTTDEVWLSYDGPPDNIAVDGGAVCNNYSAITSNYVFTTTNPGPSYAGCGGGTGAAHD